MNTQDYYLTPEWQEGEREADEDIRLGRVKSFDSVEELLAELRSDGNDYEAVIAK